MSTDVNIRWRWLRGMYVYTLVGAGGFGLGMIFMPDKIQSFLGFPAQDQVTFGAYASILLAFGILSILGLRSPLKFVPVLFMQLCYKCVWIFGVILPLIITNKFPEYATILVVIFGTYIIGDLIAIPFSYVLAKQSKQ